MKKKTLKKLEKMTKKTNKNYLLWDTRLSCRTQRDFAGILVLRPFAQSVKMVKKQLCTFCGIARQWLECGGSWYHQGELSNFFNKSLLEWIYGNLGGESSSWSTLFGMAVWWGWKWRCGNVFNSNSRCRDRVKFLRDSAKEVLEVNSIHCDAREGRARAERMIAWKLPRAGWTKLNTDGASHGNPGNATAGGVLRDEAGDWIGGFSLNIGICTAPLAELWGVYYGLYIAWEKRVTRLEVEVDSELVVGFLNTGISDAHPLSFLVRLCHGFISRDWNVHISHVYKETNRLADGLANHAFSLPLDFHSFVLAPNVVDSIVRDDARGTTFPL